MTITHRLEHLASDIDFAAERSPNDEEVAALSGIANEMLEWADDLAGVQADVAYAQYRLDGLAHDNAELVAICRDALVHILTGDPDGILDAITLLREVYRVGEHSSVEIDEEIEPIDEEAPAPNVRLGGSPDYEVVVA